MDEARDLHGDVLGLLAINPAGSDAPSVNAPDGVTWGSCLSVVYGSTRQLLLMDAKGIHYQSFDGISWSPWRPVAFTTPPQEFDLPLAEGLQPVPAYGSNKYRKNQFNEVGITISVTKTDVGTNDIENTSLLATLPAGFRPATMISGAAFVDRGAESVVYPAFILIYPDGSVRINQSNGVSCSMVIASMSFLAAG